jgi:CheY-like chemotaxis protein
MLENLEKAGYVADAGAAAGISVGGFLQESETGLASLQAKGFFVRIARRRPDRAASGADEKLTVLVVEDDAALAKLLRTYLQMEDFAVRTAGTREEISKALSEPPKPDVVLLDVMLPDIDGFDVLAKMRQHELLKNVPVIITTAKATRESVLTGLQRGADGYVTKPYDMEVLIQAVKTVLGLESGPARAWEGPV